MIKKGLAIQTEMSVVFHHPEKTESYFIDGDWKNYFYSLDDLDELAETIALGARCSGVNLHKDSETSNYEWVIDIEGFPLFYKKYGERNHYVAENIKDGDEETGVIEIIWDQEYDIF